MQYDTLATEEVLTKTMEALTREGFEPMVVANKKDALAKIKELIPQGASVMNGSSRTLEEIGFVEYLKGGEHGWNNLHAGVLAESDKEKQALLRKQSSLSDFYIGSAHSVSENGEIVIASNSGSQLPHIAFTSQNLIFVVGTQKITSSLDAAMTRLKEYVFPLEDARMKGAGMGGSFISKLLVLYREPTFMGRKVRVVFVKEKLGY